MLLLLLLLLLFKAKLKPAGNQQRFKTKWKNMQGISWNWQETGTKDEY